MQRSNPIIATAHAWGGVLAGDYQEGLVKSL